MALGIASDFLDQLPIEVAFVVFFSLAIVIFSFIVKLFHRQP